MNYGDLKKQVVQFAHRSDLDDVIDGFVLNVSQRLGRRFGVMPGPLVADQDTNSLLTTHPALYLYGCLRELGVYTHNALMVQGYEQIFELEVSEMNINYRGLDWDASCSPVMVPSNCEDVQ